MSTEPGSARTPARALPAGPEPGAEELQRDLQTHRKAEHVSIVLDQGVEGPYRYWADIELVHNALPEVDYDEIDTSCTLMGHRLAAPFVITGMTGGYPGATFINRNLARAAAEVGVAFGVGSERGAILKGTYPESFSCAREYDVPLKFANIGAPQTIPQGEGGGLVGVEEAGAAMELIGAHMLAVHLNFLQERVQPEGDRRARGCLAALRALARAHPVLAKETGAGISRQVGERLVRAGVRGIDVSGRGGTSFAAVEYHRAVKQNARTQVRLGRTFWDWGIPAPVSLLEVVPLHVPVIASGGVRSGLDAARALALGASAVGTAAGILKAATQSYEATVEELELFVEELRTAMFLTGARRVEDLSKVRRVILGATRQWLEA